MPCNSTNAGDLMAAEIEPDHGHVCARQLEMVKYFLSFVAKAYASMNRMVQYFEWTSQDVSKLSVHYESRYKETLAIQESLATTCFYMESLQRRKLNSGYKKSTLDELKSFETKMHTFNREIVTFGTSQIDQIAHLSFLCDREWADNQEIISVLKECEHFAQRSCLKCGICSDVELRQQAITHLEKVEVLLHNIQTLALFLRDRKSAMEKTLHTNYDLLCNTFDFLTDVKTIIERR